MALVAVLGEPFGPAEVAWVANMTVKERNALLYKIESVLKITLKESHLGSLFFSVWVSLHL